MVLVKIDINPKLYKITNLLCNNFLDFVKFFVFCISSVLQFVVVLQTRLAARRTIPATLMGGIYNQAQVLGLNLALFGFVFTNLQNCRITLFTCHKRACVNICLT
jgi:hypothetical protein